MAGPPPSETPYLYVRLPRKVVGVGGEGDRPDATITGNREIDGRGFDLTVHQATRPEPRA